MTSLQAIRSHCRQQLENNPDVLYKKKLVSFIVSFIGQTQYYRCPSSLHCGPFKYRLANIVNTCQVVGGRPVGYLQGVEGLNVGLPKTKPSSGRKKDLNPGPLDYNMPPINKCCS